MISGFFSEVRKTEEDDVVYLDSRTSKGLFMVRDQSYLESFDYTPGRVQVNIRPTIF